MGQGERLAEIGSAAALEDQADILAQGRLVVFDGEDVVGVVLDQVGGELALGQQGVGGEGLAGDVEGFQQWDDHLDLVGLIDLLATAYGQGADFFWVWQVWLWWPTTPRMWVWRPSASMALHIVLPSMASPASAAWMRLATEFDSSFSAWVGEPQGVHQTCHRLGYQRACGIGACRELFPPS